jgi:hypothetical protein
VIQNICLVHKGDRFAVTVAEPLDADGLRALARQLLLAAARLEFINAAAEAAHAITIEGLDDE